LSLVRQKLIAAELKLSIATVSRSLAGHPAINADTRRRVLEAAKRLGYRKKPSRHAVARRRRREHRIGVLVGLQPNSSPLATYPPILKGLQDRARQFPVFLDIASLDPNRFDPDHETTPLMQRVRAGELQGIVLVYPYAEPVVQSLSLHLPVVSALESYDDLNVDSIDTNHTRGVLELLNRLVAHGHTRIGFVTWTYPTSGHWWIHRFAAYVSGIFGHGLEFRPEWTINAHQAAVRLSPAAIADAVATHVRDDRVTAWLCAADHQAYQLMLDLQARGLRIPEDCSITGFDGIAPPAGLKPVTSQAVPNEAIGAAALTRLLNRLENPDSPQRKVLVETRFIAGATIAPPPLLPRR
jgi:LacI family transcriptional regulator